MKINSIHLQNFRQYVDEKIEFSSTPDKKVSVIYGRNYIGKTTLIKALLWCLYRDDDSFAKDPIHVNRETQRGYTTPGSKIISSVTIDLEHNGFSYTIRTSQAYQYLKTETGGRFSPVSKDPVRQIYKMDSEGNTIPVLNDAVDREIESILPANLRNYFFYDGENNKIDSVATKVSLKDAVKNIMNLNVREDLIKQFSPTSTNGVRARFTSKMDISEREKSDEIQEKIEQLNKEIENYEANNAQARSNIEELRVQADELENRIAASAQAEDLQRRLVEGRKRLVELRENRDRLFATLCQNLDTLGGTHSGLAGLYVGTVLRQHNLEERFKDIQIAKRSYSHQSEDSVNEIIRKGVCICGQPIHEGDEHYKHLIEAKEYLAPRDYSAMLHSFLKRYTADEEAADRGGAEIHRIAANLKLMASKIDQQIEINEGFSKQLEGFNGDVGEWRRQANKLTRDADQQEAAVDYNEQNVLPAKKDRVSKLLEELQKLALASSKNRKLQEYVDYVDAVYKLAAKRLEQKKDGIVSALEEQANVVFHGILNKKDKDLCLDPNTYGVEVRQDGEKIGNSTAEGIAKNLGFVAGLIYLAKNKNLIGSGDGEDDLPDDYPLFIDAPFSELDEENVRNAAKILPQYCSQLVITLLDKDYNIAKEPLQPYLDRTYHLTTNASTTNSKFTEVK